MPDLREPCPTITRDEVAHLADLARIDLSDAELDHLAPQLTRDPRVGRLDQRRGRRRRPADLARAAADQRLPRGRRDARPDRRAGAVAAPRRSEQQRFTVPRILGDEQ